MAITNVEMDGKKYGDGLAAIIGVSLDQLRGYRGVSLHPEELEWEIRLYEFILAQPDSDKAARDYFEARRRGGRLLTKREAAQKLGWKVT